MWNFNWSMEELAKVEVIDFVIVVRAKSSLDCFELLMLEGYAKFFHEDL